MINENLLVLAIVIPLMAVVLYLGLLSFWLIFSYKVTDRNITVLLFHFLPIYTVPFEKIVKMHVAPVHEVAITPGMHFFTRPFAKRVVIEMKDRWFKLAFLTPNNPDAFIAEIRGKMSTSDNGDTDNGDSHDFGQCWGERRRGESLH